MSNKIDWQQLGFDYCPTGGENARCYFRDGAWSNVEYTHDEYIPLHISAACLHYGLEAFEGLKASRGADGRVRLFRPADNAARMQQSARKLCLPVPPVGLFVDMCREVVRRNIDCVPPYESGASLYLRPLLIATRPCLGVRAVDEAALIIFASPVGPYFKNGGIRPVRVVIDRGQDRAAPLGTGDVKVGGNYASSILSGERAHDAGFTSVLYTDSVEHRYIEECGAANFFAIKGNKYITPASPSILPSITNRALQQLAADMGLEVEVRRIDVAELPDFDEVAACGTGVAVSPVGEIYDAAAARTVFSSPAVGPVTLRLCNALQDIQYGRSADPYGWTVCVS